MDLIENKTFDEIKIGDSASLVRTLAERDIQLFAAMSGDVNPAHVDVEFAKSDVFHGVIAHGMWGAALISTVLGTELPGPGTIYLGQTLKFRRPVRVGDTITVSVKASEMQADKHRITFACRCVNQRGEVVIDGNAEVIAPTGKISRPRVTPPTVTLHDPGAHYRELLGMVRGIPAARAALINPVDAKVLRSIMTAVRAGVILPTVIAPMKLLRAAAAEAGEDLSAVRLVDVRDAHEAVVRAIAMAAAGEVDMLVKGEVPVDDLVRSMIANGRSLLRDRRLSHVYVLDVPTYPRPLLLTDAMVNVYPDLNAKRDIVQNSIDLAHVLRIELPKVAILSAVETVFPPIRSTLDAAALCKMADRGQITGGALDGPLSFDHAVSPEAAQSSGIKSPVAGKADILVVPDLESGNMLAEQLEYLGQAQMVGIIMGARTPIVVPGQPGQDLACQASCAVALLLVQSQRLHHHVVPGPEAASVA